MINQYPVAVARLRGDREHMGLRGAVRFYQLPGGILVETDVVGLAGNGFYYIHIHGGTDRAGTGILPPILSCNGKAYSVVMTDRFSIREVLGRRVEIWKNQENSERFENPVASGSIERVQKMGL